MTVTVTHVTPAPTDSRHNSGRLGARRARLIAILLATALVLTNVALLLVWRHLSGGSLLSRDPAATRGAVVSAAGADGAVLTSTGNQLRLSDSNGRSSATATEASAVNALAYDASTGHFLTGTALGVVQILDGKLRPLTAVRTGDSVVGLAAARDGEVAVAHGSGAFSSNYRVDVYDPTLRTRLGSHQASFTITAVTVLGDTVAYGTINSRVGTALLKGSTAGTETTLTQPITSMASDATNKRVLVGDKTGSVTVVSAAGATLGSVNVSAVPITALAADASSGWIVAGDDRGKVTVLDDAGAQVISRTVAGGTIIGVNPGASGAIDVVPQNGNITVVHLDRARSSAQAATVRTWWIVADVVLGLALIAAVLLIRSRNRRTLAITGRRAWSGRMGYLFVLPAMVLVGVFSLYPAISAFYYSFTDYSLRAASQWTGLANFRTLFLHDVYFRKGLVNMAIVIVTSVIKNFTVPLLAAELVYWLRSKVHQYVFRTVFVLSAVVPGLVITLLWGQIYAPDGGLNNLLSGLGLGSLRHVWLGDSGTALWAIIGAGFPYLTAFAFLIYLGGLLTISPELHDAVSIDGGTLWQRFRHVDLPHLVPQFRILGFFSLVGSIDSFVSIFVLTNGGPGYSTYVPALQMYQRIGTGDLGYSSAIGLVLFLGIFVLTMIGMRLTRSRVAT